MNNVDVIIPVYRGLDETRDCIVTAARSLPTWANLVVINDCSPEPELTQWLRDNSTAYNYALHENKDNLGFVATVNFGMSLNQDNDVLLLNSDVEVANSNWLERIREGAYADDTIGSVTPFSNNATICSFPNFCEDNELLLGLSVDQLDQHFSQLQLEQNYVSVPTGVGFCMYIKRKCLDDVGLFDVETFGKGYGEENDWCQRAIKKGWLNTHQLNVFAYHKGGVSFAAEQDPRKERALVILNDLHPNYQPDVMAFIADDPAKLARIKALMSIIADDKRKKVVMVAHGMGGGVIHHIDELESYYADELITLLLQPISDSIVKLTFKTGTKCNDLMYFSNEAQFAELVCVLKAMNVSLVHYHHIMGVSEKVLNLHHDLDCAYDVTVHDFYFINGNPTLTNVDGRFCLEDTDFEQQCAERYPLHVSVDVWQKSQARFLENAQRVIFPSRSTLDIYNRFYSLPNGIAAWHLDTERDALLTDKYAPKTADSSQPLKVVVLGALSMEKGAVVLEDVAKQIPQKDIEFHLMGYAFRELDAVITHGAYDNNDLVSLINEINPDVIWFPAQWPETYCYTLSSALQCDAVIVAPDIGAFPERLVNCKRAIIAPWQQSTEAWCEFWSQLKQGRAEFNACKDGAYQAEPAFYLNSYLQDIKAVDKPASPISMPDSLLKQFLTSDIEHQLERNEQILRYLIKLRGHPVVAKLARMVPVSLQRKVKRMLSKRPIHELMK
ncbi:glycosyltransferase [Photobacterium aquae]|uniref:glycosyltransferase n=1 Tax=Photobacterium aquae TaxID=1195763 RepID=UPI00069D3CB0|nr:glycosyltransferase [Photobacterium aquae]